MSFDGAKVRRFSTTNKHFWELCAKTARFLTQIKDISNFICTFAPTLHYYIYGQEKQVYLSHLPAVFSD